MNCFSCCMTEEKISSRRSNSDVNDLANLSKTKSLLSFANISFKSDASRKRYIDEEIIKKGKGDTNAKSFDYSDLCSATNNFNPDNQLGEGGFGRVYKGQVVAVKQLDRNGYQGNKEFLVEDFNPKLSDFGLAKIGPTGEKLHVSTRVMGTYGYCAPEYALTGDYPNKALHKAIAVAAMCLQDDVAARPVMGDVRIPGKGNFDDNIAHGHGIFEFHGAFTMPRPAMCKSIKPTLLYVPSGIFHLLKTC
ncbi:hypothetical protein V6N11_020880 [Hibiscus sabdariffa]|uniref:Protein kinase domain-containing protein n=1 Tax=Hibiscus sabdariffa TaxID=183260 RepID=A0ABR2Q9P9_9ROSI